MFHPRSLPDTFEEQRLCLRGLWQEGNASGRIIIEPELQQAQAALEQAQVAPIGAVNVTAPEGKWNETILKNSFNADHHCSRHRYYRFHKDHDKTRSIPNVLFYCLDRCVRHTRRNNSLVLAAKQAAIANTLEY